MDTELYQTICKFVAVIMLVYMNVLI